MDFVSKQGAGVLATAQGYPRRSTYKQRREATMEQWDRQPKETAKAYEAFCVYRDLGVGRQYAKTARELEKNESLIRRWAMAWNWKERAEVWDKSVTEAARREAIQERMEILKETNQAARDIWQELLTAFKGKQDLSETPTKALIDGIEKMAMLRLKTTDEIIGDRKDLEKDNNITVRFVSAEKDENGNLVEKEF